MAPRTPWDVDQTNVKENTRCQTDPRVSNMIHFSTAKHVPAPGCIILDSFSRRNLTSGTREQHRQHSRQTCTFHENPNSSILLEVLVMSLGSHEQCRPHKSPRGGCSQPKVCAPFGMQSMCCMMDAVSSAT